jgi:hypothetical protein
MRQNTVVGVLGTAADLHLHQHTQPGLHYARHVLVMDADAGAALPSTGRGRAVAARDAGSLRLHRMAVCWGTDAAVRDLVLASDRPCIVAVVRGRSTDRAAAALLQLQAAGREVHLLAVKDDGAWRAIGSDAARTQVQVCTAAGWEAVATEPPSAPAPAPAPAEPTPQQAAPAAQEAAPAAQEDTDAQAGE